MRWRATASRILYPIVVTFAVVVVAFVGLRIAPGDVTTQVLDPTFSSPERIAALRDSLGLNDPLYRQFFTYIGDLLRGDLGISLVTGERVDGIVLRAGGYTLLLAAAALLLTYVLAIPLGVAAGRRNGTWVDRVINSVAGMLMATPNFALAVLLVLILSVELRWLPVAGTGSWKHLVLPTVVLAAEPIGFATRMVRTSYLDQSAAPYVDAFHARGLSSSAIRWRHILRNSLLPVISLAAVQIRGLVGYTLIVEVIFRWPGLGRRLVESILSRDYLVAQSLTLLLAVIVVLSTIVSGALYRAADPRVRSL